jgi:hypothetical protein
MVIGCKGETKDGSPCTVPVMRGSDFCWVHDPGLTEERREASRRGGKARSAQARAAKLLPTGMEATELHGRLSALFVSTADKRTEPKVAHACAALARVMLDTLSAAQQPTLDDLTEQLATLRQMIERGHVA